jgi:hypothetical protein
MIERDQNVRGTGSSRLYAYLADIPEPMAKLGPSLLLVEGRNQK